jgi:hypothetical protein
MVAALKKAFGKSRPLAASGGLGAQSAHLSGQACQLLMEGDKAGQLGENPRRSSLLSYVAQVDELQALEVGEDVPELLLWFCP